MSKKDKEKFRKKIRAQIQNQLIQNSENATFPKNEKSETENPRLDSLTPAAQEEPNDKGVDQPLVFIKKDLKKSAIIIGSIIIVIVGLYILDSKTGILLNFGNKLFSTLHLSS